MKDDIVVTNIQRFSLSDGPGIRTTVFFKGCSLRCPWCANPENINFEIEEYSEKEKGIYGYKITEDEIYKIINKDINYYNGVGGVTFSGGEPLFQVIKIENLLKKLKKEKINICFETSLFVPKKYLELAIKYADEFIIDVKILNKEKCKKIINGDLEQYKDNIKLLFSKVNKKNITFRIPTSYEYVLDKKLVQLYVDFVKEYTPSKIEIFKLHHLGDKKTKTLNKEIFNYKEVTDKDLNDFKIKLDKYTKVEILNF